VFHFYTILEHRSLSPKEEEEEEERRGTEERTTGRRIERWKDQGKRVCKDSHA
jgi:hypothetical protein